MTSKPPFSNCVTPVNIDEHDDKEYGMDAFQVNVWVIKDKECWKALKTKDIL